MTYLDKAIKEAVTVDGEGLPDKKAKIRNEIGDLREKFNKRLAVESRAKSAVQDQIEKLQKLLEDLDVASAGFTIQLSMDILKWRHNDGSKGRKGLPVFMFLYVNESNYRFSITGRKSGEVYINPTLVYLPYDFYKDLVPKLVKGESLFKRARYLSISATFSGVIPDETVERVKKISKRKIFDQILLIAEVDEWAVENFPGSVRTDPIFVGYKYGLGSFWLIDKFNTTSIEGYAK